MEFLKFKTEILVVGGGTSGVAAAIQAARMGMDVILVEETEWLGGMLTAAGVSCVDGNHNLPSGLYGEFRNRLYEWYGSAEALKTGWVSHTCFEPSVGNRIFHDMVQSESGIKLFKGFYVSQVDSKEGRIYGASFQNCQGKWLQVDALITIDATELGDVIAMAGLPCSSGRESQCVYGEDSAPQKPDSFIQDLTFVAVLEEGSPILVEKPDRYDPELFRNCCREFSDNPESTGLVDAQIMLNYGKLPNGKYMINWPKRGNDYFINALEMNYEEREAAWKAAKGHTLSFIYFIQQELGFKHLGLAADEFPTTDHLALIPYHRESRRIQGMQTVTLNDILHPYADPGMSLYQYGIAVGDYPLDHHHDCVDLPEAEVFPAIPAFNVPAGALIPRDIEGLLAAEKNISVTHVVNGCSRLQPVVMQVGQAAGALAALSVKQNIPPSGLNVRELQQILLDSGCWLMPFNDINPADYWFQACQRIGLCGIMEGEPVSKDWANGFLFHPDSEISGEEFQNFLVKSGLGKDLIKYNGIPQAGLTLSEAVKMVWDIAGHPGSDALSFFSGHESFRVYLDQLNRGPWSPLNRAGCSLLIDMAFKPFEDALNFFPHGPGQ
jgi:hypothetical protein